ncbi:30S ribosomal protein S13 [Patescibacteria group bacterium AH-259-L05]|nr:30S ribosomal protein S13 [Patescibacteria group bacterium AH-259-L05]
MARIVGVNLPSNKRVEIGLTYIFGIGRNLSNKILNEADIDINKQAKDLTTAEVDTLKSIIERKYQTEGALKRSISSNIKRLKDIKCYRGERHTKRLPVRGQQTQTNSRTIRGNVRRTLGSGRRPSTKKT